MRRLSLLLLLVLTGALAPSAAQAAPCLDTMPLGDVARESGDEDGFPASGLTVSRGTTPEPFDVTVLGVLDDGVATGVDMIIVEADSPALDRAGGIWAGMSGSPVYAEDGRFIGAVAYGLAFGPSKIGGLAAADDMAELMDRPLPATPLAARTTGALREKMVATGAVTAREASSGFERLRVPLAISGLSSSRISAFANRLPGHDRFVPFAAGAAAPPTGDPDDIFPGGNFAATFSYGDITAGGVGTTTAVCDGRAIAFGHPLNFDGPTALSAHTATAITIQDDPLGAPFKLANIGGTVGTLDQDRLSGIRAILGDAPDPIEITSTVREGSGPADDGVTNVNRTREVPDIAAFHLLGNIDGVIDRVGGGRSDVSWTVRGTANGRQFSLSRTNKFADTTDISMFSVDELFSMLATLSDNPFTDVTFTDVNVDATVQFPFRAYRITDVQRRVGAEWEPLDDDEGLQVDPGELIRLRILLALERSTTPVAPLELSLRVPADAAGREGSLDIMGGSFGGGEGDEGSGDEGGEPQTFEQLVDALRRIPRNNQVVAQLRFFSETDSGPTITAATDTAEVVTGGTSTSVTVSGGDECEVEEGCEPEPSGPNLDVGGKSAFKLAPALKKGLKLTLRTSEAGRATVKAFVGRKAARRLKLKKHPKGPVVVAAAAKRVHAGRNAVKLVFTKKARKRLRHAKRVKLSVRAAIRSVEGNSATDRFALTLKRKLR
jgi:hypothetical protein